MSKSTPPIKRERQRAAREARRAERAQFRAIPPADLLDQALDGFGMPPFRWSAGPGADFHVLTHLGDLPDDTEALTAEFGDDLAVTQRTVTFTLVRRGSRVEKILEAAAEDVAAEDTGTFLGSPGVSE